MLKRLIDIIISFLGLLIFSPVLLVVLLLVWSYDRHSPFYIAPRVGKDFHLFNMVKIRSMVSNADRLGITSTSNVDNRITPVGKFVRKYKLDELMQLWNVLIGDMSLVGPRPQVPSGVALYTSEERILLTIDPGITDFSSIVFSDEGDILKNFPDADAAYDSLIRPRKSHLGIFYIRNRSMLVDISLIYITCLSLFSRKIALLKIEKLLMSLNASPQLLALARRDVPLKPMSPP